MDNGHGKGWGMLHWALLFGLTGVVAALLETGVVIVFVTPG